MTSSAISARGLTKVYDGEAVVHDLSFEVEWGRVTAFLGPNGAGKSTTLRMILGLTPPTSGEGLIAGSRFVDLDRPARLVGAVLDGAGFHPARSGRNHLRMLAAQAGLADRRVDEVLELVDLKRVASKPVGKYSLGMKQRLGIAAALLGDPKVLVLDEPANGLDPAGIRWLRNFLRRLAADGRAVMVSSHLLAEVSHMADEAIVINRGSLVTHAPVPELIAGTGPGAERSLEDVFFELTTQEELT